MVWLFKNLRKGNSKAQPAFAGDRSMVAVRRARLQAEQPVFAGAVQPPRHHKPECPDGVPVTLGQVIACWRDGVRDDQIPVTGLGAGDPVAAPGQRHVLYDDFARLESLGMGPNTERPHSDRNGKGRKR